MHSKLGSEALRVLVTGGNQGIGLTIVEHFQSLGAKVGVLDLQIDQCAADVVAVPCDISHKNEVDQAVRQTAERLGGIDILVNNAGIGAQGTIETNTDDEWHRVFDVNVFGMVRVSRAALPFLRLSQSAAIVNMCSVAATKGLPQRALYSASKGAVLALTRAMAIDHIPDNIRVNCINPGTVQTPWINTLLAKAEDPQRELESLQARQPHGRLVQPEEVAHAVAYLASPLASSTTGMYLAVDGGMEYLQPKMIRE